MPEISSPSTPKRNINLSVKAEEMTILVNAGQPPDPNAPPIDSPSNKTTSSTPKTQHTNMRSPENPKLPVSMKTTMTTPGSWKGSTKKIK